MATRSDVGTDSRRRYEFDGKRLQRRLVALGSRALLVAVIAIGLARLIWTTPEDLQEVLRGLGTTLVPLWWYLNLAAVRFDPSELYVPPAQVTAGAEFLLVGLGCFLAGFLLWPHGGWRRAGGTGRRTAWSDHGRPLTA